MWRCGSAGLWRMGVSVGRCAVIDVVALARRWEGWIAVAA